MPQITRYILIVLTVAFSVGNVSAKDQVTDRSTKIEAALKKWANDNGIKQYSLAVGYKGQIVHKAANGQTTGQPAPLASLSKGITGSCVLALEKSGVLSRNDTLKTVFGPNHPLLSSNPKSHTITIAQLLTHSSGLRPDTTQGRMHNWMFAKSNRIPKRAREGLAADAIAGESGAFFYNNSNYFVLGAVIEHVTGKLYDDACREALPYLADTPTLRVSNKWHAIGPIGGWEASSADYLSFALKSFGPGSGIQDNAWTLPAVELRGGAYYGPGVFYRMNRSKGHNVWHNGLLCLPEKKDDHASFFAIWGTTWSVAVTLNKCVTFQKLIELDQALSRAALR